MAGGFLVTARIEAELYFDELNRAVEASVNAALVEWGTVALAAVRQHAPVGTREGNSFDSRKVSPGVRLRDTFQVTTIKKLGGFSWASLGGLSDVVVWTDDSNAIWQELGTRGRRAKHLKSGGRSPRDAGNRGVRATHFMREAMRYAAPLGEEILATAVQGLDEFWMSPARVDSQSPHFFRGTSSKFFGGKYSS